MVIREAKWKKLNGDEMEEFKRMKVGEAVKWGEI